MTEVDKLQQEADNARAHYQRLLDQRGSMVEVMTAHAMLAEADARLLRAKARSEFVEYRPDFARHVRGEHNARTFDLDGMPEEQIVRAKCEVCGETFVRRCGSGNVRSWITRFAAVHLHRDPLHHRPKKKADDP